MKITGRAEIGGRGHRGRAQPDTQAPRLASVTAQKAASDHRCGSIFCNGEWRARECALRCAVRSARRGEAETWAADHAPALGDGEKDVVCLFIYF